MPRLPCSHPLARRRALVVDDTDAVRDQMVRCLERNGYVTDRASNGADGWGVLQRLLDEALVPDVLVVDGHMPVVDGWQLIRQLRATSTFVRLPILLVSGSLGDGVSNDVAYASPIRVLAKPFRCTELVDALDVLLASS